MSIQTPEQIEHFLAPPQFTETPIARNLAPAARSDFHSLFHIGEGGEWEHLMSASRGENFDNSFFGRDTVYSMRFMLNAMQNTPGEDHEVRANDRRLVAQAIEGLTMFQGTRKPTGTTGRRNGEEFGRIHHEARKLSLQARQGRGSTPSDRILEQLATNWRDPDDDPNQMVYYGSIDATSLYAVLIYEYGKTAGQKELRDLLESSPKHYRGSELQVAQGLKRSADWNMDKIDESSLGYVEYKRLPGQKEGIANQVWGDSVTANIHENGEMANVYEPIAAIEVQASTYDALLGTADIFENNPDIAKEQGVTPEMISGWRRSAGELRQRIFKDFWIEDEQRFGQAIDRDPATHQPRLIRTASANPFHLLNTRIFDGLPESEREKYIAPMVEQLSGPDFLTDAGIRCRAASMANLVNFADYHGSWAVWGWQTHFIANGLRRQGFEDLADELDKRVLHATNTAGGHLEFFLADPKTNEVFYHYFKKEEHNGSQPGRIIESTNIPDAPQAWQVTANINIKRILSNGKRGSRENPGWARTLEPRILHKIGSFVVGNKLKQPLAAVVDINAGREKDAFYRHIAHDLGTTSLAS